MQTSWSGQRYGGAVAGVSVNVDPIIADSKADGCLSLGRSEGESVGEGIECARQPASG